MNFKLLIKNQKEINKLLKEKQEEGLKGLRRGLLKGAYLLERYSKQIVPVDTGNLKRSGETHDVTESKTKPESEVSYGTAYGIFVHEDAHATHAEGKSSHFLTKPLREKRTSIVNAIASEAKIL